jgi:hypothetical protein
MVGVLEQWSDEKIFPNSLSSHHLLLTSSHYQSHSRSPHLIINRTRHSITPSLPHG